MTAPAGYGKTTLLAQWGEADNRSFAWVSLARSDNDLVELVTSIAIALNRVEPLDGAVFKSLAVRTPAVEAFVLPRLGKEIARSSRPFVLVLDDIHMLTSEQSRNAVAALVRHIPPGSQMVLLSRREPALQLSQLRAEGALFELGTGDLALDTHGAGALLRAAGVQLSPENLRVITERTEGWPAGLYLAALALKAQGAVVTPAEGFAGDDRFVADYFGEQVLSRLSPGVSQFLTRTSVLDHFCGELCDAVLECSGSAARLRKLEQSNLFIVPLDRRRVWYRYHTLFAEMLRRRLHEEDPDLELELNRRAAAWHATHGDPGEAIHHALQAGDVAFAGDVVWAHVNAYRSRGRCATIERWLTSFTDEQIAAYPPLALAAAWIALGVDGEAMERWTTAAANCSYEGALPDESATIESALALLRATIARQGVTRMADDAALARALGEPDSPWQAGAFLAEGVAARLTRDMQHARECFKEGERIAAIHGTVSVRTACLAQLALVAIDEESWDVAASLVALARAEVEKVQMQEHGAMASVFTISALVLAHRGQSEEAHRELAHARRLLAGGTQVSPWFAVEARLILARASLFLADAVEARTLLSEAGHLLRSASDLGTLEDTLAELTAKTRSFPAEGVIGPSALTTAELRVLHYLPTHLCFREIAERLYVSKNTVKSQAMSIYRKLRVSKRSEAVRRAKDLGLIEA